MLENQAERRRLERLVPQTVTFAVFRPDFKKLGQIKDISGSGMCFEYILPGNATMHANPEDVEIDIFDVNREFHLTRIPCSVAYDTEAEGHSFSLHLGTENRRCGVKFGQLEKGQEKSLGLFLEQYAGQTA